MSSALFFVAVLAAFETVFDAFTADAGCEVDTLRLMRGAFENGLSHGEGESVNDAGDRYFGG